MIFKNIKIEKYLLYSNGGIGLYSSNLADDFTVWLIFWPATRVGYVKPFQIKNLDYIE